MKSPPPPPGSFRPPQPGPPPEQAALSSKRARGVIGAAFAAGIAIAIAVGAVLAAIGVVQFGKSDEAAVDKTPIVLPPRLDGLRDQLDVASELADGETPEGMKERLAKESALTVAAYEQAYGGAAVAFRRYADADLTHFASVIAVRAESPGLTDGPVSDPSSLGLAVSQRAVVQEGDVSCIVAQDQVTIAGEPVDPANSRYARCERTEPGLTVIVDSNFTGDDGRRAIIELTDAAFDAAAH